MVEAKAKLRAELARWERKGLKSQVWLRDDDAVAWTDALSRLGDVGRTYGVKIGLSIVPGKLEQSLVEFLEYKDAVFLPMCHGWIHANYGSGIAPDEFGSLRTLEAVIKDARYAQAVFAKSFPGQRIIFVPPYGNLAPEVASRLPELGFDGISNSPTLLLQRLARLHSRYAYLPHNPLWWLAADGRARETDLHAHVDVIDWRRQTAHPAEVVYATMLGELRLRRKRYVPVCTPIGILTHHLVHDEPIWVVLEELLELLKSSPAVTFPNLKDLFDAAVADAAR